MKKFKKYLSIFLSLILMLQIIAFPSACAEVFETFRNKQGNGAFVCSKTVSGVYGAMSRCSVKQHVWLL